MNHIKLGHSVRIRTVTALLATGGLGLAACSQTPASAPPPTSSATAPTANSGGWALLVPNQAALITQAVATVKADETANANIWSAAPPSLARAPIANQEFAAEETGQALIDDMSSYAAAAAAHQSFVGSDKAAWVKVIPGSFELLGNTPAVYVADCDASAQIVLSARGVPLPGLPGKKADDGGLYLMEYAGTWKESKALQGPIYPYSTAANACSGWFGQAQQDVVENKI